VACQSTHVRYLGSQDGGEDVMYTMQGLMCACIIKFTEDMPQFTKLVKLPTCEQVSSHK